MSEIYLDLNEIEEIIKTLGVRIRQAEQRLQETHMNLLYREDAETPDLRNPTFLEIQYHSCFHILNRE